MRFPSRLTSAALFLAAMLCFTFQVRAADILVLTVGAYKPVLLDLAVPYQTQSKNTVTATNDTAGAVTARIARGEEFDLVILTTAALTKLSEQGKIVPGSIVPLARVGIGAVVKEKTPAPDISTAEAFKKTLLAVPSLAYIDPASGGSSGIYLSGLFDRLGIADAVRRKAILVPGGLAASRVANGEAAMALQQISELHLVRGVRYIGPLPAALQNYTTYGAAIPVSARTPAAGHALLSYLLSAKGIAALTAHGLDKP